MGFLLVALLVVFIAPLAAMAIYGKYIFPGVLDAKYPSVADGDIYPIGSLRRALYTHGLRRGAEDIQKARERRQLTAERRTTTRARKDI